MNNYIIVFSLSEPMGQYPQIRKALKQMKAIELSEQAYLVSTMLDVDAVYDEFVAYKDRADYLYVFSVASPWTAYCNKNVIPKIKRLLEAKPSCGTDRTSWPPGPSHGRN